MLESDTWVSTCSLSACSESILDSCFMGEELHQSNHWRCSTDLARSIEKQILPDRSNTSLTRCFVGMSQRSQKCLLIMFFKLKILFLLHMFFFTFLAYAEVRSWIWRPLESDFSSAAPSLPSWPVLIFFFLGSTTKWESTGYVINYCIALVG